jgi:hypothetical protein
MRATAVGQAGSRVAPWSVSSGSGAPEAGQTAPPDAPGASEAVVEEIEHDAEILGGHHGAHHATEDAGGH